MDLIVLQGLNSLLDYNFEKEVFVPLSQPVTIFLTEHPLEERNFSKKVDDLGFVKNLNEIGRQKAKRKRLIFRKEKVTI